MMQRTMGRRRKSWLVNGTGRKPNHDGYTVGWYDSPTRRRERTFATLKAARAFMRGLNERFELQRMDGVAPVPLSFAHDEFLIACGRLAKSTLLDYMNTLSMLERMLGSSTLVPDITVAHIDRFLDTGHSESTEAKHYRNLRRFFRWCRTRGYCNLIPTEQVTVKPRVGIREITMPTDAQINTLVEACECSTLRIALMIGLTTGWIAGWLLG
jgi:hypothetical protein